MKKQSKVYNLPIQFKDEKKYADCIDILDETEVLLQDWHHEVNQQPGKIPYYGDQLTRVRFESAKKLRKGEMDPVKRFENIHPFLMAPWHNKQDFLEKLFKKFFNSESARDKGTLSNLSIILGRTISGDVKKQFERHEDLVLCVGNAVIILALLDFFGMDDQKSLITKNAPPPQMNEQSNQEKIMSFEKIMFPFVDKYFTHFNGNAPTKESNQILTVTHIDGPQPQVENNILRCVLHTLKKKEAVLKISNSSIRVKEVEERDDLHAYMTCLLQWVLQLMAVKDCVREGDADRHVMYSKRFIPFFFAHSTKSKYAVENMDFVLKTKVLLSEKMSEKAKTGFVVNVEGGAGEKQRS